METLTFTVDSALLSELGEKLVETVHLALVELVKNSYDADASEVEILFTFNKEIDEIHIVDNGNGMNYAQVHDFWMRIATNNKAKEKFSPKYGRTRTGEKGIGRFCCRRLGKKLRLITVGKNGKDFQKTDMLFNWDSFTPGSDLTEVKCLGEQVTTKSAKTGTTLIISELTPEWNTIGFNYIQRQLAVLAANSGTRRKGYIEDPGFDILLAAPQVEGGLRDLRDDLISSGWGTIEGKINNSNCAEYSLSALGIGQKKFISKNEFSYLKDVTFKIGILVDEKSQMRNPQFLSKRTLREILPDWGGVQIRYHGFRVYPYGDDDWLNIDYDRALRKGRPSSQMVNFASSLSGVDPSRSLLNLSSMRSYVGYVSIGSSAKYFEMKANREGFLDHQVFQELKQFVREAIDWATIYRDYDLRLKTRMSAKDAREAVVKGLDFNSTEDDFIEKSIQYLEKEIKNVVSYAPPKERRTVENALSLITSAIIKKENFNKEELRYLRLISSSSTLLLMFSHEAKSLIGIIDDSQDRLNLLAKKFVGKDKDFANELASNLLKTKKEFIDLLELTNKFSIRENSTSKISLFVTLENVKKRYDHISKKYDVEIDIQEVPRNLFVNSMSEPELLSIFINLLSNSLKSVIAKNKDKCIKVSAILKDGIRCIKVYDTGIGLDKKYYEEVFTPFLHDPENKLYTLLKVNLNPDDAYLLGSGHGIGLSIIKDIIEYREGSIHFQTPSGQWSNLIEVCLK